MLELFDPRSEKDQAGEPLRTAKLDDDVGVGRVLACSACGQRVTTHAARIEVHGRHEHTCTNPHGYRYRIGCFAIAEGLVARGDPDSEFTWFPGYTWQVQDCARCAQLLGWHYRSADGAFFGLILAHLVEAPPT